METLLKISISLTRKRAHLKEHSVPRKNGTGKWSYTERIGKQKAEDGTVILCIHGFGDNKDFYVPIIKCMPAAAFHRVIAVDLPGHGMTTFQEGSDGLRVDDFANSIKEFLEMLKLDNSKLFVIGTSFGGGVSMIFAHRYPQHVDKLALLCPAVKTPTLTDACERMLKGEDKVLVPNNTQELVAMLSLMSYKNPKFPQIVMDAYYNYYFKEERVVLLRKLLKSLITNEFEQYESLVLPGIKEIQAPTIIIWGTDDQMLHVSGAKYLNECIKNSQVKILSECNHLVNVDQPEQVASSLIEFLASSSNNTK